MQEFTQQQIAAYKRAQKKGVSPMSIKAWKDSGLDIRVYLGIYDALLEDGKWRKKTNEK